MNQNTDTQTSKDLPNTQIHRGYRQLTEAELARVEKIKQLGSQVERLILELERNADGRWLSIGRTNLQQGFMALTRAVTKPEGF